MLWEDGIVGALHKWLILLLDLDVLSGWQVGDVDFFGFHNWYLKLHHSYDILHFAH
jgi:hypothetical protein